MTYFRNNYLMSSLAGALALSVANLYADEYTVEAGKFEQVLKLSATALPDAGYPVSITPAVWSRVTVEKFLPHGTSVKKGEKLLWIDTEDLDKQIDEVTRQRVQQKLELERAELELEEMKVSTEKSLEKAELEYERFLQDYDYYKNVTKPQKASDVEYGVTSAKNQLSYVQEELDQLLKMYEEDGLTEETEEIIIKRAKHELVSSQKELEKAERDASYVTEIITPRNDADWETSAISRKNTWEYTKKNLPLALKLKELEVAEQRLNDKQADEELAKLKSDRELMKFESPVDGVVYFGEFKDGKWISEPATKVLRNGGGIPARMIFMTIVPEVAGIQFKAFFSEQQIALFKPEHVGHLRLKSNPWKNHSVKPELVSQHPLLSQQWLVSFSPEEELPAGVVVGSKATISIVADSSEEVLSVPAEAVTSNPDGSYTVLVKMAEGEPKETKVEIGRQAADKLEVLSGLANGQVILIP